MMSLRVGQGEGLGGQTSNC